MKAVVHPALAGITADTLQVVRQFYLEMVERQLTYDALRILGFDMAPLGDVAEEMKFMQKLAHEGKIIQGRLVARKQE
jgi:hypothetical protein